MTNFLVMSRTRSRIMDPEERESCRQIFDVFAPTYEDTVLKKWKYNAPARVWISDAQVVEIFARFHDPATIRESK